jgi:diguanylate cyclase (GGDEF)-like protein/PAS domain S-box-containing protein
MLTWVFSPFVLPNVIAFVITLSLLVYAWRNRSVPGVFTFFWLLVSVCIYIVSYSLTVLCPFVQSKIFWAKMEVLGYSTAPAIWLLLTWRYSEKKHLLRSWALPALFSLPLISFVLALTNQAHSIFWSSIQLNSSTPIPTLHLYPGFWYWINTAYGFTLLTLSAVILFYEFSYATHFYRQQIGAMIGALALPFTANILFNTGLSPISGLDMTPASFSIASLLMAWGLLRYRLFDLVPIARATLIERMQDGVIVLDARNRILDLNPAAQKIIAKPIKQSLGLPIDAVFEDFREMLSAIDQAMDGGPLEFSHLFSGQQHYYDLQVSRIDDGKGRFVGRLITLHDITQRKTIEQQLRILAITDPLTGLYNGRHFFEVLDKEFARARRYGHPISLMMFDIDFFKGVNDKYGHQIGDQMLQLLAKSCLQVVRKADVLARYGGEEFILLLPETDTDRARSLAERLRKKVAGLKLETPRGIVQVTISVGYTQLGDLEKDIDDFIWHADQALYKSKDRGRNRIASWQEIQETSILP